MPATSPPAHQPPRQPASPARLYSLACCSEGEWRLPSPSASLARNDSDSAEASSAKNSCFDLRGREPEIKSNSGRRCDCSTSRYGDGLCRQGLREGLSRNLEGIHGEDNLCSRLDKGMSISGRWKREGQESIASRFTGSGTFTAHVTKHARQGLD